MMFDPPDYPYKDLSDSLREYGTENLFSVDEIKSTYENKSFQQNNSGRYFNPTVDPVAVDGLNIKNKDTNSDLLVIQTENLLNFEPTLLDENTVNQFLLIPPENTAHEKKNNDENVPDLLALQSCVLCHEIFTTDADLLDHTISVHSIDNTIDQAQDYLQSLNSCSGENLVTVEENSTMPVITGNLDLDTDWLVCCICERILSTALEVEPRDQLCCLDENSKSRVMNRKLNTMYVCEYCSGLYADGESLDRHRNTCNIQTETFYFTEETNEPASENRHCDDIFLTAESNDQTSEVINDLKSNMALSNCEKRLYASNSSSSKMWNCGSCNQLFTTARELYRHKRGEDRPEGAPLTAYVCDECDKVLGSMCALHTHRKMHKVTKPGYPCKICGRRFNQSGHLAIHMRMHTGERPYPCDLCSKAFKVKVERDDHRRTHTGERPFACTACPKTFTAAARLREHARIHTDQRPYRCEICGAAFRRPYARTVHTLIHTGEKPHECDICGTAFRRSGDMWKHKRTIHGSQVASEDGKTGGR